MANEENLKGHGFHERSVREVREAQRKGGINSGKSRRRKANLKKAFEAILEADVSSNKVKQQLETLGFEATNEMALAMVMMQKAMKGDVRAFEQISKLTSIDTKDSLDKKEQRERIKAIQLENEKRKSALEGTESQENAVGRLFDKLEEALSES